MNTEGTELGVELIVAGAPFDSETNGWVLDHKQEPVVGIRVHKDGTYEISYGLVISSTEMKFDSVSVREVLEAKREGAIAPSKKTKPQWQAMNKKFIRNEKGKQ